MLRRASQETMRIAFEDHYESLLRLCVLLTGHRQVAEDLAQDAFVRVLDRMANLQIDELYPYLRRTAINLWKNRLRRFALEQHSRPSWQRNQAESISSVDERDEAWRLLMRLPSRQRACLVLRYYEDLPHRSIAEILGCSVGTVKSQISRALDSLRKEYAHEH
jgi:RNA polymerase sigma-70 factor (sigma-E family)